MVNDLMTWLAIAILSLDVAPYVNRYHKDDCLLIQYDKEPLKAKIVDVIRLDSLYDLEYYGDDGRVYLRDLDATEFTDRYVLMKVRCPKYLKDIES